MNNTLFELKTLQHLIIQKMIENEKLPKYKPTPTQIQIIDYLIAHSNEKVYQKDLEQVLNLKRATVSGVLKTMEKHNLIKRKISSQDTRVKEIILNEEAKQIFNGNKQKAKKIFKIITKDLSNSQITQFNHTISIMINNLKNEELIK